jgi:hypothetical protein
MVRISGKCQLNDITLQTAARLATLAMCGKTSSCRDYNLDSYILVITCVENRTLNVDYLHKSHNVKQMIEQWQWNNSIFSTAIQQLSALAIITLIQLRFVQKCKPRTFGKWNKNTVDFQSQGSLNCKAGELQLRPNNRAFARHENWGAYYSCKNNKLTVCFSQNVCCRVYTSFLSFYILFSLGQSCMCYHSDYNTDRKTCFQSNTFSWRIRELEIYNAASSKKRSNFQLKDKCN